MSIVVITFQIGQYTGMTLNRTVSLQTPGCMVSGIVMHELLHTLGKIFSSVERLGHVFVVN